MRLRTLRMLGLLTALLLLFVSVFSFSACSLLDDGTIDDILSDLDSLVNDTDSTGPSDPVTVPISPQTDPPADTTAKAPETDPPAADTTTKAPETDPPADTTTKAPETDPPAPVIDEKGHYTSKDDVALYIHTYGKLPSNFIKKADAEAKGWSSSAGNLWKVTDHMSIGGDYFGNYEGQLPKASGRKWYECDINYNGGYRGGERILYSNDGLIYYTDDHYETFTMLYDGKDK